MRLPGKISFFLLLAASNIGGPSASEGQHFRSRAHNANYATVTEEDVAAEVRFGQSVAARVLGRVPLVDKPALTQYINLVGKSLVLNSTRPELEFRFAVLDGDEVNAYSAPGGFVFVTVGALKQMRDEAELAAVLAHEIAHIAQRHIVKALHIKAADEKKSGLAQLIGGAGDTARVAFFQTVDKAVSMLFESGFNHNDELEADRVGILLLTASGYDPTALSRFLDRIQAKSGAPNKQVSTTHPPTKKRTDALQKLLSDESLDKLNYPRAAKRFMNNVSFK